MTGGLCPDHAASVPVRSTSLTLSRPLHACVAARLAYSSKDCGSGQLNQGSKIWARASLLLTWTCLDAVGLEAKPRIRLPPGDYSIFRMNVMFEEPLRRAEDAEW